jgi:hypothetical protein
MSARRESVTTDLARRALVVAAVAIRLRHQAVMSIIVVVLLASTAHGVTNTAVALHHRVTTMRHAIDMDALLPADPRWRTMDHHVHVTLRRTCTTCEAHHLHDVVRRTLMRMATVIIRMLAHPLAAARVALDPGMTMAMPAAGKLDTTVSRFSPG